MRTLAVFGLGVLTGVGALLIVQHPRIIEAIGAGSRWLTNRSTVEIYS